MSQPGVAIHSGFPNPASDSRLQALDFNQLLIQNSASTFTFRIRGNQWQRLGIFDDDLAVIDRAPDAHRNELVVWWHNDEFAISYMASTPENAQTFGVVTAIIHQFRTNQRG
jgi:SOS-response transcriptional repressor LexA